MIRKKKFSIIFISLLLLLVSFNSFAQDCTDGPGLPGDDPDGIPCDLPLDTWVFILVIAAVIYGAYRMHQKQKSLVV